MISFLEVLEDVKGLIIDPKGLGLLDSDLVLPLALRIITFHHVSLSLLDLSVFNYRPPLP